MLALLILSLGSIDGLRLPPSEVLLAVETKKDLFCLDFVGRGVAENNFDLQKKAMMRCDGYAFYSTEDVAEHNMVKIMDVAPANKRTATWEFALKMWSKIGEQKLTDKYNWFVKVDTDAFLRPDKLRATLARFDSSKPLMIARQGRNSHLPVVGSVHALTGPLVDELQTVKHKLEPAKQYLRDDRLLSAWTNLTSATIHQAINDDNGCTTFATTDREDLPSHEEILAMAKGQSYTKSSKGHGTAKHGGLNQLGEICYSPDLAVIHPIKDRALYEELINILD